MIYSVDQIRNLFAPFFEEIRVERAVLFGSYARGDATEKSDIDIFLDSGGRLRGLEFLGFCEKLQEVAHKSVEVIEKYELIPNSAIFQRIRVEGVVIYG